MPLLLSSGPFLAWVKARDITVGDIVRTIDGPVAVTSVEPDATQPVFNFGVGAHHGILAGTAGVLAHDDSPIPPTPQSSMAIP